MLGVSFFNIFFGVSFFIYLLRHPFTIILHFYMFHIKIIDHNNYFRLSTPRTTKKLFIISAVYHLTHYVIQKYAFFVVFLVPIPNGDLQYLKKILLMSDLAPEEGKFIFT